MRGGRNDPQPPHHLCETAVTAVDRRLAGLARTAGHLNVLPKRQVVLVGCPEHLADRLDVLLDGLRTNIHKRVS